MTPNRCDNSVECALSNAPIVTGIRCGSRATGSRWPIRRCRRSPPYAAASASRSTGPVWNHRTVSGEPEAFIIACSTLIWLESSETLNRRVRTSTSRPCSSSITASNAPAAVCRHTLAAASPNSETN